MDVFNPLDLLHPFCMGSGYFFKCYLTADVILLRSIQRTGSDENTAANRVNFLIPLEPSRQRDTGVDLCQRLPTGKMPSVNTSLHVRWEEHVWDDALLSLAGRDDHAGGS